MANFVLVQGSWHGGWCWGRVVPLPPRAEAPCGDAGTARTGPGSDTGVRLLVYLAAFLYRSSENMHVDCPENDGSMIPAALRKNGAADWLRRNAGRAALYGHTLAANASWAAARLVPEPNGPVPRPLALTAGRFGRIPRVYIECLHDRAVPLPLQKRMQRALPCAPVISMATDHSPFLSAPGLPVAHLHALAGRL